MNFRIRTNELRENQQESNEKVQLDDHLQAGNEEGIELATVDMPQSGIEFFLYAIYVRIDRHDQSMPGFLQNPIAGALFYANHL